MNTCPIAILSIHFWYGMWELLENGGNLYITAFDVKTLPHEFEDNLFLILLYFLQDFIVKLGNILVKTGV